MSHKSEIPKESLARISCIRTMVFSGGIGIFQKFRFLTNQSLISSTMHQRNIFQNVNFGVLAEKYSFFKEHVLQDPKTSKYNLDFGNDDAVRALNRVLLLEYYNLDVDIPNDCLIPRVPLRLNYILWIEDLLNHFKDQFPESKMVVGLDIGTGPCAIYALLGAKKNSNWIMHGSDINELSIQAATLNVQKNHLEDRIKLHQVTPGSYFSNILENKESNFDFSMCNPPFFSDTKDELVSENYPSIPWSLKSQIQEEIVFPGGEVSFVDGMIKESYEHHNAVKIYTSMIGVKKHLESLLKRLREYKCNNFTTCVFHQGRISRWGLAWSWDKSINLKKCMEQDTTFKKSVHTFEAIWKDVSSFKSFVTQLVDVLSNNLGMTVENGGNQNTFIVTAEHNTWSHSRRKRRRQQQQLESSPDKIEDNSKNECPKNMSLSNEGIPAVKTPRMEDGVKKEGQDCSNTIVSLDPSCSSLKQKDESTTTEKQLVSDSSSSNGVQVSLSSNDNSTTKHQVETGLHFKLNATRQSTDVIIHLHYLNGKFGRDGLHQVLQYLKNQSALR